MKLYGRLLAMTDFIGQGEKVADIGTDHGLLPIFLYKNKVSPKIIMTDVNIGPLDKAKENIKKIAPEFKADLRLGNGLEPLEYGEVDTIVIAGMGGDLIKDILKKDLEKTKSFKKIILQPRTKQKELREFLYKYAFKISYEKLVKEGRFICEIIVAEPMKKPITYHDKLDLEISPLLFHNENPLLEEFIEGKIKRERHVLEQITSNANEKHFHKVEELQGKIKTLEDLKKKLENTMGIKIEELLYHLNIIAPRELEEDWDNGGFQINMRKAKAKKIMVALEITKDVIREAVDEKVDFIITHHPLLMSKIAEVDAASLIGGYIVELINHGITVYSAHTNFDSVFGGNNDYLADLLDIQMVRRLKLKTPFGDEELIGRMGSLKKKITLKEMVDRIVKVLNLTEEPRIVGKLGAKVKTVALCTGAGAHAMDAVIKNNCDLFITGDVRYHQAQKAKEMGLNVIDAGHYGTEYIFIENFANKLRKALGDKVEKVEIIESTSLVNPFESVVY